MIQILLIEDDESLGDTIAVRLGKEGYKVLWTKSTEETVSQASHFFPDLVLIDIRLPDGNGLDLPEKLGLTVPFLFLSAEANAENRLRGIELGAMEFLPKPFHFRELLLRIKRLSTQVRPKSYLCDGREIHLASYSIKGKDKTNFPISEREARLLELLLSEKDKVLSREEIRDRVLGKDRFPTLRTIDNSIVRLRDLLGARAIRNVRGVGYQFVGQLRQLSPSGNPKT